MLLRSWHLFLSFSIFEIFLLVIVHAGEFSWDKQEWKSEQERDFWMSIPDWGEMNEECYQFRYNHQGDRIDPKNKWGYTGFARGFLHHPVAGYFRLLVQVRDGWIEMKKVWDDVGKRRILRSYQTGVLSGRYIDWYENGHIKSDGTAQNGEKNGLWTEWYENGQKKEEGVWKNGKPQGIFEEWYENGEKANEQVFEDGLLQTGLVWKPDGSLCSDSKVDRGMGILVNYNLSGNRLGRSVIRSGKKVAP